eukprot:1215126-Amphidinium_carterae.1
MVRSSCWSGLTPLSTCVARRCLCEERKQNEVGEVAEQIRKVRGATEDKDFMWTHAQACATVVFNVSKQ